MKWDTDEKGTPHLGQGGGVGGGSTEETLWTGFSKT